MRKFNCLLNNTITRSPEEKQHLKDSGAIKGIVGQLKRTYPTLIDIPILANHACNGGLFAVSCFEYGFKDFDHITESNLITLDFDNKSHNTGKNPHPLLDNRPYLITISEALERCKQIGITPNIVYHSPSSTPELEKFRFVFLLDEPCSNPVLYQCFMNTLLDVFFPEADTATALPHMHYYGGNGPVGEVSSIDAINIENLDIYLDTFARNNEKRQFGRWKKRYLTKIMRKYIDIKSLGASLLPELTTEISKIFNEILTENVELGTKRIGYIDYIEYPVSTQNNSTPNFAPNFVPNSSNNLITLDSSSAQFLIDITENKDNFVIEDKIKVLQSKCQLFQSFCLGEKLSHYDLVRIARNIYFIKGGESWFMKTLKELHIAKGNHDSGKIDEMKAAFDTMRKKANQFPWTCEAKGGCPFLSTCKRRGTNIYAQMGYKASGRVYKDMNHVEPLMSLEAARGALKSILNDIASNPVDKIYCVKATTGIGKSHSIIEMIKEGVLENVLYAVPTHPILEETKEAIDSNYFRSTGKLPRVSSKYSRQANKEMQIGLTGYAGYVYRDLMEENEPEYFDEQRQYLANLDLHSYKGSVLTTHAKLSTMHDLSNFDTIIIDEDYDGQFTQVYSVTAKELNQLIDTIEDAGEEDRKILEEIRVYLKRLRMTKRKVVSDAIEVDFSIDLFKKFLKCNSFLIESKLFPVVNSSYRIKADDETIYYSVKLPMFQNKKVIILSASIRESICKMQYGNDIEFIDVGEVEETGKTVQCSTTSMSRKGMESLTPKELEDILKKIIQEKIDGVITFKNHVSTIEAIYVDIKTYWYGNCSGVNALKGKNIAVIGTPYPSPDLVKILYATWTGNVKEANKRSKEVMKDGIEVSNRGYCSTMFNLFKDEEFRAIQLYLMFKEVQQACGRARTVQENSIVYLFSTLPIGGNVELPIAYNN